MKRTLTIFAATFSALALIGCEVSEPKKKTPLKSSPVSPGGDDDTRGKTSCEEKGQVTSANGCITKEESCTNNTSMKWEASSESCIPRNSEPTPEEKCKSAGDGKVWNTEKQTCDAAVVAPPAPVPVPEPAVVPGAMPASGSPDTATVASAETIQKKAVKASFLISTKTGVNNCYLPIGALLTMQADTKEVTSNTAQATATITQVEGATCTAGVWNYFQTHLK